MASVAGGSRELVGRVYVDANVFICFLERDDRYIDQVAGFFEAAYDGRLVAVTGDAAVAEVMIGPYRTGDADVIRGALAFLGTRNLLDVRPHTHRDFDAAARLRAERGIPLIDGLHLATAQHAHCDYLLTNDARMPGVPGLEVVRVAEI